MRYYRGCFFTAGLRKENPELETPKEEEVREVQLQGLVQHLTGNHTLCWPEVCWHKNNPELVLPEPTLENSSAAECSAFRDMLGTIFRMPKGQGIVTAARTSHNEAFNREKLVFLDKKIDYWKTYSTRHACAVMLHNLGFVETMKNISLQCGRMEFSCADLNNLQKMALLIEAKQLANRKAISNRNSSREVMFAAQEVELQGIDFSTVS